jgi:hypothetical protein
VWCERVRGVKTKGGQLLTDQGQGWMGIRHHEKRSLALHVSKTRVVRGARGQPGGGII